jgi:hypothetical protein
MSEESSPFTDQVRALTKCLADLNIFFAFQQDVNGKPIWGITFVDESLGGSVTLTVRIERDWIIIYHVNESEVVPSDADLLGELLKLSADFAVAKIGLDVFGHLAVLAQIPFRDLSPEALQEGLGASVAAVAVARKAIAGERKFNLQ